MTTRKRSRATTARKRRAKSTKATARRALAKSASGVPERHSETDPGFRPSAKQLAYIFAMRDALIPGTGDNVTSDAAMARRLKMSRQTLWEWKHTPAFVAWWQRMLSGCRDIDWDLVLDKHTQLAIRGSVRSAEFLGRVRSVGLRGGGFNEGAGDVDQSVLNYTIVSLVPRPPALPGEKVVGNGKAPEIHP